MIKLEDFPKKCMKCKTAETKLNAIRYSRVKSHKILSVDFPACDICARSLTKAIKLENFVMKRKNYILFSFFAFIFVFIFNSLTFFNSFNLIIIQFILFVIFFVFLLIYIIAKINPNRIKKYIILNVDGSVFISDPEYRKEMEAVISSNTIKEIHEDIFGPKADSLVYCPKCGKKQNKNKDFCDICGKDLRTIEVNNN